MLAPRAMTFRQVPIECLRSVALVRQYCSVSYGIQEMELPHSCVSRSFSTPDSEVW